MTRLRAHGILATRLRLSAAVCCRSVWQLWCVHVVPQHVGHLKCWPAVVDGHAADRTIVSVCYRGLCDLLVQRVVIKGQAGDVGVQADALPAGEESRRSWVRQRSDMSPSKQASHCTGGTVVRCAATAPHPSDRGQLVLHCSICIRLTACLAQRPLASLPAPAWSPPAAFASAAAHSAGHWPLCRHKKEHTSRSSTDMSAPSTLQGKSTP